jgi:uncharacterized membrane protein YpjA
MSPFAAFFLGGMASLLALAVVRFLWSVAIDVLDDYQQIGPRAFFSEVVTSLGYATVILAVLVVALAILL